jgi:hypothetical protein
MTPINIFKRRLAKLIEIFNEMALNAGDRRFARGDITGEKGTIYYVFDETVFQAFLNPDEQRRKYAAYFHLEDWRKDGEHEEKYWILINEMISALATEYMLMTTLPGQVDRAIYMTSWHLLELGLSHSKVSANYAEMNRDPKTWADKRIEACRRLHDAIETNPNRPIDDSDDRMLETDLNSVRSNSGAKSELELDLEQSSFRRARRLARIFAANKDLFVSDQLSRLGNLSATRISVLDEKFAMTPEQKLAIESEGGRWAELLRQRMRAERTRHGLLRDGRSLALVQHIARYHLNKFERIVLITGDRTMLETYWSWYGEQYVEAPWEPNVIRSMGHFSPIMNLNVPAAFELMQVALNLAIVRFNLSADTVGEKGADPQKVANLWSLRDKIIKSVDNPNEFDPHFFPRRFTSDNYSEEDDKFNLIRDKYQELERNSFRIGLKLFEARAAEILNLQSAIRSTTNGESYAQEYFRTIMKSLVVDNVRFWLPIVQGFLKRQVPNTATRRFRPPLNLKLFVPTVDHAGESTLDMMTFEQQITHESSVAALKSLEGYPHLILTLGALVALRRGLWNDASRYSEMAKAAYRHIVSDDEEDARNNKKDYQELRYLRAVCARLVIGNANPEIPRDLIRQKLSLNVSPVDDIWLTQMQLAILNLERSREFHERHNKPVRASRCISERAAVRLFYCAWAAARDVGQFITYDLDKAKEVFEKAMDDLTEVFLRVDALSKSLRPVPSSEDMLKRVRGQILANLATADVIHNRSAFFSDSPAFERLQSATKESVGIWLERDDLPELSPRATTMIIDFAGRHRLPTTGIKKTGRIGPPRLALDRELTALLKKNAPKS